MALLDRQHPIGSGFSASTTAQDVLSGADLRGLTAVVTGGYSGLGLETARALVAAGAEVIVPARRERRARERLAGTTCTVVEMDLADVASVRRGVDTIARSVAGVNLVIAAAGVMASPERRVGPGWESQFAINHLGHFALVNLLGPIIADGARIVSYSSLGHHLSDIRWADPHFDSGYDKWKAYGQSKTANILFAAHLDAVACFSGVRAFSLHPGSIITDLQRDMTRDEQVRRGWIDADGNVVGRGFKTPAQGAATGLWAATSPDLDGIGGVYCEDCDVAPVAGPDDTMDDGGVRSYALDADHAGRLWQLSAELTGVASYWPA